MPRAQYSDEGHMEGLVEPSSIFFDENYSNKFMNSLPEKIRTRAQVLLSLDGDFKAKEEEFKKKQFVLYQKYAELYQPFFQRRKEIVCGEKEPTEEEIQKGFPEEHKEKVSLTANAEDNEKAKDIEANEGSKTTNGIPDFWLKALRHHVVIEDMITNRDAEILKQVTDVYGVHIEDGIVVFFVFKSNEYFEGTQLSKAFHTRVEQGEEIVDHTDESIIVWKEGKNPTVEMVTKKQVNKHNKKVREVAKEEPCDSFFNLFKKCDDNDENNHWASLCMTLINKVIPYAVEYVTGEAPNGNSDVEDEGDEEDEESDPEEVTPKRGGRGATRGRGGDANEKDCKQQ